MKKKLIFLDIDGTLTQPGKNIPPASALEAIRQAQAKGHLVFICTGRNYDMLSPLLQYHFDGVIGSAGGYVECLDEVIYDCPMTADQQKRVLTILKEHGVFRTVECKDGSFTDDEFKQFLKEHASEAGNSELLRWREQLEKDLNIQSMTKYKGQPVYKVVFMSPGRENLQIPEELLKNEFHFIYQSGNQNGIVNGEILNRNFDKGLAVKRVAEHLHISMEDTVAFGDSMNDLEMMEVAGLSICMENGSEQLKEIADDICPSVENDGILCAFRKYQLL